MELKIEILPFEKEEVNELNFDEIAQKVLPTYTSEGSSGMDLRAISVKRVFNSHNVEIPLTYLRKSIENGYFIIRPGERFLIGTGFKVELPSQYELQIRPKSGNSLKLGLEVILGTIDSDYRGEIGVILTNTALSNIKITFGDFIAQMVLVKIHEKVTSWDLVKVVLPTSRGEKGFGQQTEEFKNKNKK